MPLTSQEEVRQFIGLVNYYHGISSRHSHMLAPLTKIMHSKVKFKWNKIKQEAFKEIKRIVARNVLSSYPGIIK